MRELGLDAYFLLHGETFRSNSAKWGINECLWSSYRNYEHKRLVLKDLWTSYLGCLPSFAHLHHRVAVRFLHLLSGNGSRADNRSKVGQWEPQESKCYTILVRPLEARSNVLYYPPQVGCGAWQSSAIWMFLFESRASLSSLSRRSTSRGVLK